MPFYVHRNNQQLGPYSAAEVKTQLASGALSLQDHVWWQGQNGWVPLADSELVKGGFKETPAPAPFKRVKQSDPSSIWAFAIGSVVANLACAVGSVAAIAMGHTALWAIKKDPKLKGRGLATIGLAIGYVMTLLYLALFIFYFMYTPEILDAAQKEEARAQVSAPNLPATTIPSAPVPSTPADNSSEPATNAAPTSPSSPDSSTNAAPMSP